MMRNNNFLDVLTCLQFAITLINYQQNLQQSDNDDIMRALDQKTNRLIEQLQQDLAEQNKMLKQILGKLEKMDGSK